MKKNKQDDALELKESGKLNRRASRLTNPVLDEIGETEKRLEGLAADIVKVIREAREFVFRHVNSAMVVAYWNVGRYIVEFEQHGDSKARYGTGLLTNLSKLLAVKLGRGYSRPNLNNMRKFYLAYPICQNVSDKLN